MTWSPRALRADTPVYLALADSIAEDVAAGRLRPGHRLPTHRELAHELGVDLTTVTRGYAKARRRGLLPVHGTEGVEDPSRNFPPKLEPDLPAMALTATLEELSHSLDVSALMKYQDNEGMEHRRQAGASWVGERVPDPDPTHLVVTSGAQHAISVLLSLLASPGDGVMTESLTYPALCQPTIISG